MILETATKTLLAPFDLEAGKLERVFGVLGARKIDYADLYFQYTRSEGWSLEEGIVKSGSFNIEQGVGVRAVAGEKTAFAYSDEISFDALHDAAKATRAIAAAGQVRRLKSNSSKSKNIVPLYRDIDPVASLDSAKKVALLEKLEKKCRELDPRVTQVMASLGGEYEVVLIARADGTLAADVRPLVRLSVQVIAEANGRRESGSGGGGGRTDYSHFTDEALDAYARHAVSQALVNLEARPAPAAAARAALAAAVGLGDHLHGQAHERTHVRRERAVGARDQDHLVFPAEARHHLGDARVERAALALQLLEQRDLVRRFERGHRVDRPVQGNRDRRLAGPGFPALSGGGDGAGRPGCILQRVEADLVGIGERRLFAGHRTHADALLDVEAARLDDALLEAPAFVARVLEVEVRIVDLVRRERAEDPIKLGAFEVVGREQRALCGIQVQFSLRLTSAGSEARTSRILAVSISASTTPSPSGRCASTSPHGSTIMLWP